MPRVWLRIDEGGHVVPCDYEHPDGMAVDMNASLRRQISASIKQFMKFQRLMMDFYNEAVEHPDTVRRVR